jgi:hypothetical protein
VGEDAKFMWNTTDGKSILTVTLGLFKDGVPDPQFINVNSLTGRVIITYNQNLSQLNYVGRVKFIGNLKEGHAWFILMDLILNDTNKYVARIGNGDHEVLLKSVELHVKEKKPG